MWLTYILFTMHAISPTDSAIAETAPDAWEPGPLRPRLGDGAVHVWRADLAAVSDHLIEVLSPDERARAERFLKARDGRLWARCHGVLRVLLGRYLDSDPRRLRFATGAHGKPTLIEDSGRAVSEAESVARASTALSFNLSHSGHLALYAFSKAGAVGVDVEVARRALDVVAIAARAFGAAEARRLRGLAPAIREEEFRRTWVRHESALKCWGTGIGNGSTESEPSEPWIAELDMGVRGAAAVAVEGPPHEVRCWDLAAALAT